MGKNIIILVMSCNQDKYIKEEQAIRETWGKDILDGKFSNVLLYFYRGGYDSASYDTDNKVIKLKGPDTLRDTYTKTLKAFRLFENFDYDYLVRVNTSTFINIKNLLDFVDNLPDKTDNFYCCRLLKIYGIIFRGNAFIIHKSLVDEIGKEPIDYSKKCADDVGIAKKYRKLKNDENAFIKYGLMIPNAIRYELRNDEFKKNVFTRLLSGNNKNNTEEVCDRHRELFEKYKNEFEELKVGEAQKFTVIETTGGERKI